MTNELPPDTWTEIISFSKPREILNILLLSSTILSQLNENDSMWKQLCYRLYGDNSVSEKIRRVSKKVVDEKKQQEINSRQRSVIRDELEPDKSFRFIRHTEDVDTPILKNTVTNWRDTFYTLCNKHVLWRDAKKAVLTKVESPYTKLSYEKTKNFDRNIRVVMCGKHINSVRQVATRLAASYKQDFVPLDGIKDIFTIRLGSGELVIIHIIEQPYHYTRNCDGSTNVNGIIYVVDMNTFDKEYRAVYRHFHDIAGEFRANTLHCLLIGFDAEQVTLEQPLELHDPLNYNTETHYTPMDVLVGVLRINEMYSCHWYRDSIIFYCNSTEQQLLDVFEKKWTGKGKGRKLAKDVSDVIDIIYSYSSSDEEN